MTFSPRQSPLYPDNTPAGPPRRMSKRCPPIMDTHSTPLHPRIRGVSKGQGIIQILQKRRDFRRCGKCYWGANYKIILIEDYNPIYGLDSVDFLKYQQHGILPEKFIKEHPIHAYTRDVENYKKYKSKYGFNVDNYIDPKITLEYNN